MEVQGIHYKNNGDATQKKISTYQKEYGFYSSGYFSMDYQLATDEGLKYGTKISITQTTRNSRSVPLALYLESNLGKLEAGSDKSAGQKMKITGYIASCGTGGGWDSYIISSPTTPAVPYVTNFCNFLDAKTRTKNLSDYARKITYFTPKFGVDDHKFQIGLSYIPDTSNAGHDNPDAKYTYAVISDKNYEFAIKDGVTYGVTYNGKFSELLSAKVALIGENGKPIAFEKDTDSNFTIKSEKKFKKLFTYNIGTEITYGQLSVAASYMNYNKSLTNPDIDKLGLNTSIYDVGIKYKFCDGKYAASLNHFHSDHKKNKLDATSIGLDYLITSGIKTYAELTYYTTNGRYIENATGNIKNNKSKGTIAILGAKVTL